MGDVPKFIFIIPYRDRLAHKSVFLNHMNIILEDEEKTDYEFLFIHQEDDRPFNRGAMKNIGFMYIKDVYPENYKDMTVIFHDIDTVVHAKNIIDFNTDVGTVKHLFGFKRAFGGIVAFKGCDFEKINGFPNIWGWGYEDNALKLRWTSIGGDINYSNFIPFSDNRVILFYHGDSRDFNVQKTYMHFKNHSMDGIDKIDLLQYEVGDLDDRNAKMINVKGFKTLFTPGTMVKAKPPKQFTMYRMFSPAQSRMRSMGGLFSMKS
jgi:hypothetical protein